MNKQLENFFVEVETLLEKSNYNDDILDNIYDRVCHIRDDYSLPNLNDCSLIFGHLETIRKLICSHGYASLRDTLKVLHQAAIKEFYS